MQFWGQGTSCLFINGISPSVVLLAVFCRRSLLGGGVARSVPVSLLSDILPASYSMLRNSASGPEIDLPGRLSAGF